MQSRLLDAAVAELPTLGMIERHEHFHTLHRLGFDTMTDTAGHDWITFHRLRFPEPVSALKRTFPPVAGTDCWLFGPHYNVGPDGMLVSVTRGTTTGGCVDQGKLAAWTRMRVYPC